MYKQLIIILSALQFSSTFAADIYSLKQLFKTHYSEKYVARYCNKNVDAFIKDAQKKGIDLSGAMAVKLVGGGFLETSGFYTRTKRNERAMLGYFHWILVADGYAFDFDLGENRVLGLEDYIRLQFTPPYEPYKIYGIDYTRNGQPSNWSISLYHWHDYINDKGSFKELRLDEFVDMNSVYR